MNVRHVRAHDTERELREAALRVEIAQREAQLTLTRAQSRVALLQLPALGEQDIADALGVPHSTWVANRAAGGTAPPRFRIGRRLFTRSADLLKWLAEQPSVAADNNENPDDDEAAIRRRALTSALQAPYPPR